MADISLKKTLPNNLEAERALLGAVLMDNAMPSDVRVTDLYLDSHRRILATMKEMADRNEPITLIGLKNALQIKDELKSVGGAAYLASLTDGMPNIELAPQYLRIIRRAASLRRLISMGNEVMARGYKDEEEPRDIIAAALDACDEASAIMSEDAGLKPVADFVHPVFREIECRANSKKFDAFRTGYADLDNILSGGLRKKNMIVIAGRPSSGKTAFFTNMMVKMATLGTNCAFFSLEMGAMEIVERMLSVMSRVESHRLRTGFLNRDDWAKVSRAAGDLCELPIWIDDSTGLTVGDVRSRVRKVKVKHRNGVDEGRIELIGVDYLQLMSPPERLRKNADETAQVTAISKGFKEMAKNLDVVAVAISQLSRASEKRTNRRPQLSDIRQSGHIEQDSDVVAFVHRDEMGDPNEENTGMATLIIAKQRNGPIGDVRLAFAKQFTAFDSLYAEA